MNHHRLKIYPEHYNNVKSGTKTFEIRDNDRGFQKGDLVTMFYWKRDGSRENHDIMTYTSKDFPSLKFKIGDVYPIDTERVVFSLLPIEKEKGGEG